MSKRLFKPEDALRLKSVTEPDLSVDGRRVAFVLAETDREKDRLDTSIWIVSTDGSSEPRRFSEGPSDRSPRFSPDGRWLAYLSAPEDKPEQSHVRLAALDGGTPQRLGDLPGPVLQLAFSPDSRRLVVVCRVGMPSRDESDAAKRNAPRRVRGLAARLDGMGWKDGRAHLFLIEVEDGSTRQLTRGDFDHADPAFAPDGGSVVCASDRSARRDDRQFRSDAWIIAVGSGRPRRLTGGHGWVVSPVFSPDGKTVAFAGQVTEAWDEDPHGFVVRAEGSGAPEQLATDTDRPAFVFGGVTPVLWTGERDLVMLVIDRGSMTLHRARLGQSRSRELVGGDIQIDGFATRDGRRIVFTGGWVDRLSELYVTGGTGQEPVCLSHFNDEFTDEVELAPAQRSSITREDGTEVEYFTLMPPKRRAGKLPLHLEVHGGPHGWWPLTVLLALHQAIAGAGYCLLLPNPRGSASYGQQFTSGCTHDWGGGDYEDILACCDDVIAREALDPRRTFVSGYSYGGFMTGWIVGHTDRFRAATAGAAVIDQVSMALTSDIYEFSHFAIGGTPWEQPDEYRRRSPLTYLPQVKTPVLVAHWEGDIRVPPGQGEELYSGLRALGKEAEFLRYPGGFHAQWTPSQAVDFARQILDWNQRHDAPARGRRTP